MVIRLQSCNLWRPSLETERENVAIRDKHEKKENSVIMNKLLGEGGRGSEGQSRLELL